MLSSDWIHMDLQISIEDLQATTQRHNTISEITRNRLSLLTLAPRVLTVLLSFDGNHPIPYSTAVVSVHHTFSLCCFKVNKFFFPRPYPAKLQAIYNQV